MTAFCLTPGLYLTDMPRHNFGYVDMRRFDALQEGFPENLQNMTFTRALLIPLQ
jgi:hypothetical protein